MGRELTPRELDELLGAHALDAVDGDEREQLEEWLERTPAAAGELSMLRETAALLAHVGGDAPPGLWSRIEESLSADPPQLRLPESVARLGPTRRRRGAPWRIAAGIAAASAAAAAITAVIFSAQVSEQEDRIAAISRSMEKNGVRQAALAAAADPDARMLKLVSDDGMSATFVTMPDGAGFVMADHVPRLGADQAYQLWALTGDPEHPRAVSAGVLGRRFEVVAFRAPAGVIGFVVTMEPAAGAPQPSGKTMLTGSFA